MIKILISNDDGVYARGINVLADYLRPLGKVTIVAPDRNRSGASNSLTFDTPVRVRTLQEDILSVEGTPTDCVHLALTGMLEGTQDMVVSGINEGQNLGDDVWYSGTVAAAIEGRFLGLPAIAFSLVCNHEDQMKYFETAGLVATDLVRRILIDPLPASTILSVNVPNLPYNEIRGYEVTRLGTRHSAEPTIPILDPRGSRVFWIGPAGAEEDAGPGTDFHAIRHKKVSITPLQIDITNYKAFDQLSKWAIGLNNQRTG